MQALLFEARSVVHERTKACNAVFVNRVIRREPTEFKGLVYAYVVYLSPKVIKCQNSRTNFRQVNLAFEFAEGAFYGHKVPAARASEARSFHM